MERKNVMKKEAVAETILLGDLPDLVILSIKTLHSKNRRWHYISVKIENASPATVKENFTLALFIELKNKEKGVSFTSVKPIGTKRIRGLGGYKRATCRFIHYWPNPDEDVWEARFIARVDYKQEIKEKNERNNTVKGNWFPPY